MAVSSPVLFEPMLAPINCGEYVSVITGPYNWVAVLSGES